MPGGGYIAGRADLVAAAAARLTAPGVGLDAGCVPGDTLRLMAQGAQVLPCLALYRPSHVLYCKHLARGWGMLLSAFPLGSVEPPCTAPCRALSI